MYTVSGIGYQHEEEHGVAPQEVFPEDVWVNIIGYVGDLSGLRKVCTAFRNQFVPQVVSERIEEFRSFPGAIPSLARFHIELPEKNDSPAARLECINTVFRTITRVSEKMQPRLKKELENLLPFSPEHVDFCPFEVTKFFQTVYAVYIKDYLRRFNSRDVIERAKLEALKNRLETEEFERVVEDLTKEYGCIRFWFEEDMRRIIRETPPRKKRRIS